MGNYKEYNSWDQFVAENSLAYQSLQASFVDGELDEIEYIEDFQYLIQDCGDQDDEEVSSDYIMQAYFLITDDKKYRFDFTSSQYRKDGGLCPSENDSTVGVTEIVIEEKKTKAEKTSEHVKNWNKLFLGKNLKELQTELLQYKFPKK